MNLDAVAYWLSARVETRTVLRARSRGAGAHRASHPDLAAQPRRLAPEGKAL